MSQTLLYKQLSANLAKAHDDVLAAFVKNLRDTYSTSLMAVVFYGSCMRTRQYEDAVLDFYVIVDSYRNAYTNKWIALLNKLLPPNVFYIQINCDGQAYRAKYAVISERDLEKRTSNAAFHPYFWARFAQPIAVAYTHKQNTMQWLASMQQQSVLTMVHQAHCMLVREWTSEILWVQSLQLTYSTELRTESKGRANTIYTAEADYFDGITAALLADGTLNRGSIHEVNFCKIRWIVRSGVGKLLSVLRLLKATVTFTDGIDYIAWKVHRHTGETIEVNERLRKYPWLFSWPILWRLMRRGKIR